MAWNLHAIAAPFAAVVTGSVVAQWLASTGYTTAANGKRTPVYDTAAPVDVRVQSLSTPELALLDGMNIQGIKRAVYVSAHVQGDDRKDGKGGDLLKFDYHGEPTTWLVVTVLEDWDQSGWCKVACVKQIDATA